MTFQFQAGFNRNILGCKEHGNYSICSGYFDLIETYWDVKKVNDLVLVVAQRFNRNIVGYKLQNIKNEGKNMYGRKNNRNNDLLLFCLQA